MPGWEGWSKRKRTNFRPTSLPPGFSTAGQNKSSADVRQSELGGSPPERQPPEHIRTEIEEMLKPSNMHS